MPQGELNKISAGSYDIQMSVPQKTLKKMGIEVDPVKVYAKEEIYNSRGIKGTLLGRAGHISEAAAAIYFPFSPLSNYVTSWFLRPWRITDFQISRMCSRLKHMLNRLDL